MTGEIANVDMAALWDEEGRFWADHADRYDRVLEGHHARLLAACALKADDVVLDIGCGNGQVARDAARIAHAGSALGVDLSPHMLTVARERAAAEGLDNVAFERADAQVHPFVPGSFSLATSRFGAMFFADPVAAFANIGRALGPGGRLAILTWQSLEKNEWTSALRAALAMGRDLPTPVSGVPGPYGLSDADHVRTVLTSAGFEDVELESIEQPGSYGADADDAFEFLRISGPVRGMTQDLDEATRDQAFENLRAMLAAHETADGVRLGTAAWLVRARR